LGHLEVKKFKTVTTDKLRIERLEKLLGSPLIDEALSRAAIFYTSISEHHLNKKYMDIKIQILEELKK